MLQVHIKSHVTSLRYQENGKENFSFLVNRSFWQWGPLRGRRLTSVNFFQKSENIWITPISHKGQARRASQFVQFANWRLKLTMCSVKFKSCIFVDISLFRSTPC